MKQYADLLDKSIKEANLSLTEISNKCEEAGVKVTVSYLSKLRNKKMPPPSLKVTAVLAKVINISPERLLAAGVYDNQITLQKDLEEALKFVYPDYDNEQILTRVFSITYGSHDILNRENLDYFDREYTDEELEALYKEAEEIESIKNGTSSNLLQIPILGKIAAGTPIIAEENTEYYITVENKWNLSNRELFALKIKGDSMKNSRIYDGDTVIIKKQPDVENGEIAAVLVNGDDATLKKVKKYDNGETWLFPSNDDYAPIRIENENARIIGKVIQVIFEP